jgi:Mn2+/Fe2+ NRAMP family transporter
MNIKNPFKKFWRLLLAVGPGIFAIGYTIGTGSVTSMITTGSIYGTQLLWVILLSAFFAWALMESYGRLAVVTGRTAINCFKTEFKFGKLLAILVIIGIVLGQWSALSGILGLTSNLIYEVVRIFIPTLKENNYWAILGIAIIIIIIMYGILWGGKYSLFEKILIVMVTIMGLSFIVSMFIVLPPIEDIATGLIPRIPAGGNLLVAALVGTTLAAPTFVVRPLTIKEKGWDNTSFLKNQKIDALISAIGIFLISASIMIAATGALFNEGKSVTKVLDMVYALEPAAGEFAVGLFMVGTMGAGLSSIFPILMVLPLLVGDYKNGKMGTRTTNFRVLTAIGCLIGLIVPIFGMNPIMAQIATQVVNVFVLPLVITLIIILVNRKAFMKGFTPSIFLNFALSVALVFSLFISYTGILGIKELF